MDKLSDKIKFNAELSGNKFYEAACNDFLPEIEKLESEKEELIKIIKRIYGDLQTSSLMCLDQNTRINIYSGKNNDLQETQLFKSWQENIKEAKIIIEKITKKQE